MITYTTELWIELSKFDFTCIRLRFNSPAPSPACMRQETVSALVQAMTWCRQAPSHCLIQYWFSVNWALRNKLQWYSYRHSIIFIDENAFENIVCDFPTKLSRGRWGKIHIPQCLINIVNYNSAMPLTLHLFFNENITSTKYSPESYIVITKCCLYNTAFRFYVHDRN